MKKLMVMTLALALMLSTTGADLYPATMVVCKLDYTNDLVICEDYSGNEWAFEGIEDWDIGDMISMIMNDMNTPIIEDDEIVMVRYSGYTEGL